MKKLLLVFALVVVASWATAALAATTYWRVVKSKSVSGQFAVTAVNATVSHPRGLAVRLSGGGVSNGNAVVACSRGVSTSAYSKTYSRAGLFVLPVRPARADTCSVTAAIGGSGRVTVQILKAS